MALVVDIGEKRYQVTNSEGELVALKDVHLSIGSEEFVCLVGPSGCGKSTLLHIISGLDSQFAGEVVFEPDDNTRDPIGYVFQSPRLMPWLTVRKNVHLVADNDALAEQRAESLLQEMGLGDFLDAFPNQLSGGMQRRVALARAFVNKPRYLLLDEPFVSLDLPTAQKLRQLLLQLWRSCRSSVLFVTHDLREALYLADRILFMSSSPGQIVYDYTVDLTRPRDSEGSSLESMRRQLLARNPEILAGLVLENEPDVA